MNLFTIKSPPFSGISWDVKIANSQRFFRLGSYPYHPWLPAIFTYDFTIKSSTIHGSVNVPFVPWIPVWDMVFLKEKNLVV